MSSFAIVFRMGDADDYTSPMEASDTSYVDVCFPLGGLRYSLDSTANQLSKLSMAPTEVGIDFALLGGAVYAADTRISRSSYAQDGWTREIGISLPVSDPRVWNQQKETLQALLKFLTGDIWRFEFRDRPEEYRTVVEALEPRLPIERFTAVSLFSGGLDSLVGAIDQFQRGENPILVSHHGEGKSSVAQRDCFDMLSQHYSTQEIERISSGVRFPKELFPWGHAEESTTRGRSFLFFSLAAVVASSLPSGTPIYVPENGLISLNVPIENLRLGALSTRTTHPYYIEKWSELLSGVGLGSRLINPYQMKTKGEMLEECGNTELLKEMIPVSISCSNPTGSRYAGDSLNHCGICVPCIIRRASIRYAFDQDDTGYRLSDDDLVSGVLNTNDAIGKNYRAFQLATGKLLRNPNIARLLIHKSGPLDGDSAKMDEYADLYLRGMQEVASVLEGITTEPL
jgi:7-cyano-7-deazaguanine synthase in queuosine biosynthesis